MPPQPPVLDDATLNAVATRQAAQLSAAVTIEVFTGPAHKVYARSIDEPEPLVVLDDPGLLRGLLGELAAADLTHCVVVPALAGVALVFKDATGEHLGSLQLLSPRWVRGIGWQYDGLLGRSVLGAVIDRLGVGDLLGDAQRALDHLEPALPAAARPRDPDLEHAVPQVGAVTLCGIPPTDVTAYRHTFRYRADDCRDCSRLVWSDIDAHRGRESAAATPRAEAVALTTAWVRQWPGLRPIAHELRSHQRWLRFHSLPDSRRYASNDADYAEILRRHRTVLDELAATTGARRDIIVVTCSWSSGPDPYPRSAPVTQASPTAHHWQSILADDSEPDYLTWTHLFVERTTLDDPRLEQLLLLVADDWTADVIIADSQLQWLYHPYDGGADVYPATTEQQIRLRAAHREWLSLHPSGL